MESSAGGETTENADFTSLLGKKRVSPSKNLLLIPVVFVLVTLTFLGYNDADLDTMGASVVRKDGLLYFNAAGVSTSMQGSSILSPLSISHYPRDGPCIAALVTNRTKDIEELQTALESLQFLGGDKDPNHPAPVLIFTEGNLNPQQVQALVSSTNRPVAFPLVDFQTFPPGFDINSADPHFLVKGRTNKWGYYQMIRFWVTGIWEHPALDHFETVMRIDSDSCFKEKNDYLPNFHHEGLVYHSQYVGFEDGAEYLNGLYDFAKNHMAVSRAPSEPRNFLLWDFLTNVWESKKTLPVFRTNFEVSSKSFMQSSIVKHWHEALTEKEPYGVLRYRWGDAVTRFLTAAIFENSDKIFMIRPTGYFHKIGCSKEEVREALATLKR